MAHIFDVMVALNGQMNVLSNHYLEKRGSVRTIEPPKFLNVAISRAIENRPKEEVFTDPENDSPIINLTSMVDTGDNFNPLYVCVAENIKIPIIDKIPVIINHKDQSGPGVAIVVVLPMEIFGYSTPVEYNAKMLFKIYSQLANMDPNNKYKIDASIIRYSENSKIPVPTYDLTMAYVALGCVYINLRTWYKTNNKKPISASYIADAFEEGEMDEDTLSNITTTLNRNAKTVGTLRDSVATGDLLLYALYDVDENE